MSCRQFGTGAEVSLVQTFSGSEVSVHRCKPAQSNPMCSDGQGYSSLPRFLSSITFTCKLPYAIGQLSCLSSVLMVTLVYCGQTVGWIKMKLGVEVGLGPSHVLNGDPAPPPTKGTGPQLSGRLWWPNGWMDQDATWYGGRPRPRPHYLRWGPCSLKGAQPPIFGPCLLWPNGCSSQLLLSTCILCGNIEQYFVVRNPAVQSCYHFVCWFQGLKLGDLCSRPCHFTVGLRWQ